MTEADTMPTAIMPVPLAVAQAADIPALCRSATALFAAWDAVHDAADDLPGYDGAAQQAAEAQGAPLIAASAATAAAIAAMPGTTAADRRAKAELLLLVCRNRAGEDADLDLAISLARDVLASAAH